MILSVPEITGKSEMVRRVQRHRMRVRLFLPIRIDAFAFVLNETRRYAPNRPSLAIGNTSTLPPP